MVLCIEKFSGMTNFDNVEFMAFNKILGSHSNNQLVKDFFDKNIEVVLFLSPFPPALWEKINHAEYPIINEAETYIRHFAAENQILVVGSNNPYLCVDSEGNHIQNSDYDDQRHISTKAFDIYFSALR